MEKMGLAVTIRYGYPVILFVAGSTTLFVFVLFNWATMLVIYKLAFLPVSFIGYLLALFLISRMRRSG